MWGRVWGHVLMCKDLSVCRKDKKVAGTLSTIVETLNSVLSFSESRERVGDSGGIR